jgi:putative holliday junction resolvase
MPELRADHSICVLAFDFGLERIGVAVGQSVTGTAAPLSVLKVRSRADRLSAIAPLVSEWQPDQLVVGEPRFPDGQTHEMTMLANKFARQLSEYFRLPFVMVDERYTTVEAQAELKSKRSKDDLDAHAAVLIAQQYLSTISRGTPLQ